MPTVLLGVAALGIGAIPILWLAMLSARGRRLSAAWWWMGAAFGVSFAADAVGAMGLALVSSQTYPVLQAALFCIAFVPRRGVEVAVAVLLGAAAVSLGIRNGQGWDVLLHVVAWTIVSGLAFVLLAKSWLRASLGYGFAALIVAWLAYTTWPGWWTWAGMQAVRLATALGWCVAARQAGRDG